MSAPQVKESHQIFLQSFMSRAVLDAQEVKRLYKYACEKTNEAYSEDGIMRSLAEFVITINANIRPFHMEIKKGSNEDNGLSCYCLVNLNETAITRLSTDYSQPELELFKKMIEFIVESDDGFVSSTDVLNLTDFVKRISKKDAENLIERLRVDHWINVAHGKISLSTRSIIELEQYIKEQFCNKVTLCTMCKKLCLKGQMCSECDTKLHLHCALRYFSRDGVTVCPGSGCNNPWPHQVPQRETTSEEATESEMVPRTEVSTRKRKGRN